MLQNLYVKNLALIDETEVEFGPGLNILTGETGAGKSLLLGSVNLALGGKYSADMLRSGAKSGLVELTFTVDDERIRRRLEQLDLFPEDGCLTLSRRLMEGRSVSRINGETVSARVLRDAAGLLIDIHGQHENQTLLQRKNHLALLDLYAKEETSPLRKEMAEKFRIYQELCRKKESSALDDESRRKEAALAEFEVKEIEDAALVLGEDEELEDLYRRMTESRRVTESVAETYQYTGEDARGNASDFLSRAIRSMQEAAEFDETGSRLYGQLIEIDSLLNDFNRELSEYAKSFEFSDEEFQETETRLNLINHLKAKYGKTISEILAYCGEKRQRLTELEDYDTFMRELDKKTEEAFRAVEKTAEELHKVRERAAETFAGEIQKQMAELNFLDARLEIRLTDAGHYSASGKDEAEFYFSANPGEPLKPMGNVASGGELSRVMLAVKTVLADEEDTPTLIFDEIDTGISGITAGKVGEKLRLIGRSRQVICITHLPQIAAAADSHFLISKETDGRTVKTDIALLDEEASVQELARMLGGANVTGRILESAGEMKELAKSET
ncbi:MAG: DNA repair protein RecN [Mediterraneibacter sp.]|mgnify:FL=1